MTTLLESVAQVGVAGVDDLVGDIVASGGARDDVVLADSVALKSKTELTLALEDQKHLFLASMGMKRALRFARGQDGEVVAKLSRTDPGAELRAPRCVVTVLFDVGEFHVIKVHEGLGHEGSQ
jgi:hypothetical protein